MTPEEKELLERAVELSEENNDLLRSMHRSMKIARIMSIVYWVFIIGSAVGAFYLIQPYVDGIISAYGNASTNLNSILGS
jgi:Trk-type K+ transport system membrane component